MMRGTHRILGFTLLELLIVVVIIGILAAIAYPGYQRSVREARRSDAMTALMQLQLAQEKLRANCPSYAQDIAAANSCADSEVAGVTTTDNGYYTIGIKSGTASGSGYVALATPTGAQSADECGTFAVDQDGPVTSHDGTSYAGNDCWRRQ